MNNIDNFRKLVEAANTSNNINTRVEMKVDAVIGLLLAPWENPPPDGFIEPSAGDPTAQALADAAVVEELLAAPDEPPVAPKAEAPDEPPAKARKGAVTGKAKGG